MIKGFFAPNVSRLVVLDTAGEGNSTGSGKRKRKVGEKWLYEGLTSRHAPTMIYAEQGSFSFFSDTR